MSIYFPGNNFDCRSRDGRHSEHHFQSLEICGPSSICTSTETLCAIRASNAKATWAASWAICHLKSCHVWSAWLCNCWGGKSWGSSCGGQTWKSPRRGTWSIKHEDDEDVMEGAPWVLCLLQLLICSFSWWRTKHNLLATLFPRKLVRMWSICNAWQVCLVMWNALLPFFRESWINLGRFGASH